MMFGSMEARGDGSSRVPSSAVLTFCCSSARAFLLRADSLAPISNHCFTSSSPADRPNRRPHRRISHSHVAANRPNLITALLTSGSSSSSASSATQQKTEPAPATASSASENDPKLLLHCVQGLETARPPVWLMRQAGRYMAAFREYSDKYPFRHRSETPEIAIELSLQPFRAFQTDGVIMFSDILTPLPALGIEFDIRKGVGPRFEHPLRTPADIDAILDPDEEFDPVNKLPFVRETLSSLQTEVGAASTILGFVGCPFTLAAYAVEGRSSKEIRHVKAMMYTDPALFERLMEIMTKMVAQYVVFQLDSGADVVQLFESWAHHLTPAQYERFVLPWMRKLVGMIRKERPNAPLVLFLNGVGGKLEMVSGLVRAEEQNGLVYDALAVDWGVRMAQVRNVVGDDVVIQGNVDPAVLFGSEESVRESVRECVRESGLGGRHVLNLGHGVMQGTPELRVAQLCDEVRNCVYANM